MITNCSPREEVGCIPPVVSETTLRLSYLRHVTNVEVLHLTCQTQLSTTLRDRHLRFFLVISRGLTADWTIHVYFDPLFLDCHATGNDLPVDRDELGSVPLNRTCGHSTSAWCQLGNGLRIVNGESGQWKRLRSRMGHALDDDDDDLI